MPETNKLTNDIATILSSVQSMTSDISTMSSDISTILTGINELTSITKASNGGYGSILAAAGSTSTGDFSKAIFLTAGRIAGVTASGIAGSSDITSGTTFAAGTIISGTMESIEVQAGLVLIHKGSS